MGGTGGGASKTRVNSMVRGSIALGLWLAITAAQGCAYGQAGGGGEPGEEPADDAAMGGGIPCQGDSCPQPTASLAQLAAYVGARVAAKRLEARKRRVEARTATAGARPADGGVAMSGV